MTTEPCQPDPDPIPVNLTTDFAVALADLTTCVLGSTETGPCFETVLAVVNWMRTPDNVKSARILIGDLTAGY